MLISRPVFLTLLLVAIGIAISPFTPRSTGATVATDYEDQLEFWCEDCDEWQDYVPGSVDFFTVKPGEMWIQSFEENNELIRHFLFTATNPELRLVESNVDPLWAQKLEHAFFAKKTATILHDQNGRIIDINVSP